MKNLMENWRKYIEKEKLEENSLGALLLGLGMAGSPAAAGASPNKEPTHQVDKQQAESEYDFSEITIGYINSYVKHLESKAGKDIDKKTDINFRWMPIQKEVYDLGIDGALKSKNLDATQKDLLKLVIKQIEKSDAKAQNYYGKIGSQITMKESAV